MPKSISVCIPTFKRPDVLALSIRSCLNQTLLPAEILIGDDSPDNDTQVIVETLARNSSVPIRYFHDGGGLGQARNVDRLVTAATSELIAILHDDDEFAPDALMHLAAPFDDPEIVAAYGKQFVMSEAGVRDDTASEEMNSAYFRTDRRAGVRDAVEAAIVQQFPNDGYLVSAVEAKRVGYLLAGELGGDACDFMFGLLLAHAACGKKFFFVNEYTAAYRLSANSVTRRGRLNDSAYHMFKRTIELDNAALSSADVTRHLRKTADVAISQAFLLGRKREGLRWFFSRWHRRKIFSVSGLKLMAKYVLVGRPAVAHGRSQA